MMTKAGHRDAVLRRAARLLLALAFGAASAATPAAAQRPPGAAPTPAGPTFLFSPNDERSVSFTADGNAAYFTLRVGDGYWQGICVATKVNGRWSTPQVAPFSGGPAIDADPFVVGDGKTLYFASNRTPDGGVKQDLDIWVVSRGRDGWGAPHPLSGKINGPSSERSPVLAASGRLYFSANKDGRNQIFYAEPNPGGFGEPISVGDGVNGDGDNPTVAVSPAEDLIVFASLGRDDETLAPGQIYPRGDLYWSRRGKNGWSEARRLAPPINSPAAELSPAFSKDGKSLYFTSERGFATDQKIVLTAEARERGRASPTNGRGNIYRIDAHAIGAPR
jgi:hypothetical protein